jgi:N-acetylneuraminic acid mutarotase
MAQAGDGRLYAVGGCVFETSGHCATTNSVEAYDPHSNSWSAAPALPVVLQND